MPTKAQLEKEVAVLQEALAMAQHFAKKSADRVSDLEHRLNHAQIELWKLHAKQANDA